jgi:hypothetical protein
VDERYHLACLKATLEQPATRALRELLLTRVWQDHGELARVFTHAQRAGAGDEQRPALVGFHAPQASFCA